VDIRIDPQYLTGVLEDLVRIDSTNPALVEDGAGEEEIAEYVAEEMTDLGLEVTTLETKPGRPSVVGVREGAGGGRSLMLNGHTDTVGVAGMEDPFEPEIRGARMYGRGTQDMKGSLAAHFAAVKALNEAGVELAGDLVLACVADEEHGSIGTEAVLEEVRTHGAVVTEPTDLELCLAHKGFVWIDVMTVGRAAHGSRPEEGIDANMHLGRILHRLESFGDELREREGHDLAGAPSLHVPRVRGGQESSVYAARAQCRVERRVVPGESVDAVSQEIQDLLDALAEEDDAFKAGLEVSFSRDPYEIDAGAGIAESVRGAAVEVFGTPPEDVGASFWTDAGLLGQADVETVVLGPIGSGLHTTEEWVDLDSCADLADILARTAMDYCSVVR
jgi:acetylornithine deacetylase